uniref:Hemagglutinin-esterase-fusion glycoprotein n=1 Tax=Influenza D virus (D/bovine/Mexico/S56/2015) TaxID=1758832 RepID=A0A192MIR6_9ORTO|nr:hemagglutinin-esterase [Influenza D virus (D/bovine/Mexico/S56/2015)]
MFLLLATITAITACQAERELICIVQRVNESFSLHSGFGGNVYSMKTEPMTGFTNVTKGASVINQKDWVGFGDSRTDLTNAQFPASSDVPLAVAKKFRSLSGASLMLSAFGPPGKVDYLYQGCGKEKVFYEGVNWSPEAEIDCFGSNWTQTKKDFYSRIYEAARGSTCMTLVNSLDTKISSKTATAGTTSSCSSSWMKSPLWYAESSVNPGARPQACGTEQSATFTLPTSFGIYKCNKHVVQLCYFVYENKTAFNTLGCGDYYQNYYDGNGNLVGGMDNRVAAYRGIAGSGVKIECPSKILNPGTYSIRSTPKFLLVPKRSYCFDTDGGYPIQVVQSEWSASRRSDNATEEACLQTEGCIFIKKTTPYVGEADDNHGDIEMRQLLSGLGNNDTVCVSQSGYTKGETPFVKDYLSPPKYGRCQLKTDSGRIPTLPSGLIIPQAGTDSLMRTLTPATRIFGIDDLIFGLLFIGFVAGGVAGGYFWGRSSGGGGGASVSSTQAGFDKIGKDIQQLRNDTNAAIEGFNRRIAHDEQAIKNLAKEIEDARAEALVGELGIIRSLIVANISMNLKESLYELANQITKRGGGIAQEAGPGCWYVDSENCDASCKEYIFNFNGSATVPTLRPVDTNVVITSDPYYLGSTIALCLLGLVAIAAFVGVIWICCKK